MGDKEKKGVSLIQWGQIASNNSPPRGGGGNAAMVGMLPPPLRATP